MVVPIGLCILYAVLRLTVPPRLLSVYVAFCIFVAILSKYQLFPTSWQVHFLEEAIIRQLVPTVCLLAVAWASKAYFRRRLPLGDPFSDAPVILVLSLIVAPAVMFHQGLRYQSYDSQQAVIALYGAFINNIIIATFFVMGRIVLTNDWRRYAGLVLMLGIAITTSFVQFRIFTAIAIAILLGAPGRMVVISVVALFTASYVAGMNHIPEIMMASPDSGIRLKFIADALTSVIDTHGIGIGYGTESVRWVYHFPNMPDFTFLPDSSSMSHQRMLEALSTGIHNSFIQALLRTGALGFFLLVAVIFAPFPPRNLPQEVRNHAAIIFIMMFIACFVNPALESPIQVVGIGFVYGYLLALRASAQISTPAIAFGPVRPTLGAMPLPARP